VPTAHPGQQPINIRLPWRLCGLEREEARRVQAEGVPMVLESGGVAFHWRGSSPFCFIAVPEEESEAIKAVSTQSMPPIPTSWPG
jgi:hypothetical protein